MKFVIANPKDGKAYSHASEDVGAFLNKKIGEDVVLDGIGLSGYVAKISGGSDKQGCPMRPDLEGTRRRKIFVTTDKKNGTKIRKAFRGRVVADDIEQLNLVVQKMGSRPLSDLAQKPAEEKKSAKEEMIEESLKQVERSKEEVLKEREKEEGGVKKGSKRG